MGFPLAVFFLLFVFGMSAHAAASPATVLAVAAVRAWVLSDTNYFFHFIILNYYRCLMGK